MRETNKHKQFLIQGKSDKGKDLGYCKFVLRGPIFAGLHQPPTLSPGEHGCENNRRYKVQTTAMG